MVLNINMQKLKPGDVFDNPKEFPPFLKASVIDIEGEVYVLIENYMPYKEHTNKKKFTGIIEKDDSFTYASRFFRFDEKIEVTYLGVIESPSDDYEELWKQYETFKNSNSK